MLARETRGVPGVVMAADPKESGETETRQLRAIAPSVGEKRDFHP